MISQYIVLHYSLGYDAGVAAAQTAHAATECLRTLPVPPETYVCVLRAENSAQIEDLGIELTRAGVHHVVIREPDEPYCGAAVALGVEPTERDTVRGFFRHLKVFRSAPVAQKKERSVVNGEVGGSSPPGGSTHSPVAQEERLPANAGSETVVQGHPGEPLQ